MPPGIVESSQSTTQTYDYASAGRWKCPPSASSEREKISWLQKSLWYGQQFLQSNTAAATWESSLNILANRIADRLPMKLSRARYNRLKRSIREIISTLTNINPRWDYTSDNEDFKVQAEILNKRLGNWWLTSFVDRAIKQALQWGVVGAGYIMPVWARPPFGSEEPDVVPRVFSTMDVIPDQIHRDGDIQKAYAVHIRDTMPYSLALATYPDAADVIVPDRFMKSGGIGGATRMLARWAAPIFNAIGMGGVSSGMQNAAAPFPEVDVYTTYISDQTINETSAPIHTDQFTTGYGDMARTAGTRWEYEVPPLGSALPDGTTRWEVQPQEVETGNLIMGPQGAPIPEILTQQALVEVPNTRPAGRDDAKLYPLRRVIVWTSTAVLYDGPSWWWHGKVPVVQFTMDKWHWEFLGFDIVEENRPAQEAQNSLLRGMCDQAELGIDPPTMYHDKEFARNTMENVNMRVPGTKIPRSGMVTEPIAQILPYQQYVVSPATIELREGMKADMDYQLGVQDMTDLAKLQQAPSAETIDRLLQAAGPLIHDYAREMERALTELGYMIMWLFLEFDTTARRMQLLGRDGVTKQDWDFQPGSLIPDIVPGLPADAPLMRKALLHGRKFKFNITPRSVFNVTDIQNKLFLLQLWRDPKGFPMDPWSLAKAWNIPNFGEPPTGVGADVVSRWAYWMEQYNKLQVALQIQAATAMMQAQGGMMAQGITQGLAQGGPGGGDQPGGMPGQDNPEGRPPTAQTAPHMESRPGLNGNGPTSTVAES